MSTKKRKKKMKTKKNHNTRKRMGLLFVKRTMTMLTIRKKRKSRKTSAKTVNSGPISNRPRARGEHSERY
jgi:hypothetical protein